MEVIVKGLTDNLPCFVCGNKESMDVAFSSKAFKGALCAACLYLKVKPEVKNVSSPGGGPKA